jgi:hypothetical protein
MSDFGPESRIYTEIATNETFQAGQSQQQVNSTADQHGETHEAAAQFLRLPMPRMNFPLLVSTKCRAGLYFSSE